MRFPYAMPGGPGVVLIYNGKCPRCSAERTLTDRPVVVRVHRIQPHRRRGKSISKQASWRARYPLQCKACRAYLKLSEVLTGEPFRFVQMELREEDFYDTVIR